MKLKELLFLSLVVIGMSSLLAQTEVVTGADVAVTDTESGKVRGFIQNGIYTYKGIPYATAERFMPAKKWNLGKGKKFNNVRPGCSLNDTDYTGSG